MAGINSSEGERNAGWNGAEISAKIK